MTRGASEEQGGGGTDWQLALSGAKLLFVLCANRWPGSGWRRTMHTCECGKWEFFDLIFIWLFVRCVALTKKLIARKIS